MCCARTTPCRVHARADGKRIISCRMMTRSWSIRCTGPRVPQVSSRFGLEISRALSKHVQRCPDRIPKPSRLAIGCSTSLIHQVLVRICDAISSWSSGQSFSECPYPCAAWMITVSSSDPFTSYFNADQESPMTAWFRQHTCQGTYQCICSARGSCCLNEKNWVNIAAAQKSVTGIHPGFFQHTKAGGVSTVCQEENGSR